MTRAQGLQLGTALVAWSEGRPLEARTLGGPWIPFFPEEYEKLNVEENLEWRVLSSSPRIASGLIQRPGASAR